MSISDIRLSIKNEKGYDEQTERFVQSGMLKLITLGGDLPPQIRPEEEKTDEIWWIQKKYLTLQLKQNKNLRMSEKEFYEKIDKSIASTASGPIYTMGANETGEKFINRLLSRS